MARTELTTTRDAASPPLDPRINAYREDLASDRLRGKVKASRFVAGKVMQVARAAVVLRSRPVPAAGLATEALFGEHVVVYDEVQGWAWCQIERDGYVGYLPANALTT